MSSLYARPSENVSPLGVWTVILGASDVDYPPTGLNDQNPAFPFKSQANGNLTLRATFAAARSLAAIQIVGHTLAGAASVSLTNGAGMAAQAIAIPANSLDGLSIGPFKDFSAASNRSSTTWTLTITGAPVIVEIGEILLLTTVRSLPLHWGTRAVDEVDAHPIIEHRTDYGVSMIYDLGTRVRSLESVVMADDTERADLISLARDARIRARPFWFVAEDTVNDGMLVRFSPGMEDNFRRLRTAPNYTPIDINVEEVSKGLL